MLDNVELIVYMKFQKILITGCRYMIFHPFVTLSTFVPLWCPNVMEKLEKTESKKPESKISTITITTKSKSEHINKSKRCRRVNLGQGTQCVT